ncbi:unnamed protein product [Rotaria sordida]|uniref:Uncharacterized protein n=1 Tax=Rotaria sordida TaxID=392033 RepID=A0A813RWW7_9BILA|nr:unnamed protein product [Rotaria sordida]
MADTSDDELLQIDNCIDIWSAKMATSSDFQRLHNVISTNQVKINNHMNDLDKLVQKLGTSEDSEPLRERYHRLQNETKSFMQETNRALEQLRSIPIETEADHRRRKNLLETLLNQHLAALNRFQEIQRKGARKEKESLERARAVTYRQQSLHESQDNDQFNSSNTQLQQQSVLPMEQQVDLRGLHERDEQLRQIETNIVEVNELFKDVAKIVHEHGGIIDTTEQYILDAESNVGSANKQLTQAVTYQTSARRPPTLLPNTSNFVTLDINENNSIELHCPVIITPDLSIQWSKNNEDLDPMWSSSNLVIKRFILKIHQAHSTDAGLYKCNVVNGFGSIQAQFRINIKSNRTISNNNAKNNEQQNVINWDLDSLSGEAPEFISRNDDGQIGPTKVIQPEGTTVQLKCLASGKPTPEIRWKKNGKTLSEDEYGVTQTQILIVKDLRQSDTGNYTCELFNSFGAINTTYILVVTEKLQFFGNDPQNTSVERGKTAILYCRVQTNDPTTKIQWLKKIDTQQSFRPDAIVFGSEQYENIEQSQELQSQQYSNNILSKSLVFSSITPKEGGQYICLIQNDKATNYKKAFINIIDNRESVTHSTNINNNLFYVIIIPLCILGLILFFIFCFRHRRRKASHHHNPHSHSSDVVKSSIKPRQPLIHHNGTMVPSTTTRTSNDYIANSIDSIPVTRQYQQHQRYGPPLSSDLASLTSSNLYYARVQAL